ncbi:MAG TPA: maleylpyruvate isomerase N-terminal domain-containing protein [Anaerolineales bacterium]|nr:maleylpyruvate isomerase N-terminal domain-containing protein [Anaerolineales bacterium]
MTFPFAQENTESRRRLETLVRGLTDADFARSTDYGWTISALLAHLAFWDQRMIVILKRWKETGFDPSPIDSAAVNDALKVLCHALEPRAALELCLSSAAALDAELESLSSEFIEQIKEHSEATSSPFRMNRSLHRNDHVKDIESLISR